MNTTITDSYIGISIRLTPRQYKALRALAQKDEVSMSELIRRAIRTLAAEAGL